MSGGRITGGDGECGGNVAPYVLGALAEDESRAFVEHLSGCAVCREEVAALSSVAAALPAAAPQFSAPPELKRRIFAEVEAEARVLPQAGRAGAPPRRTGLARARGLLGAPGFAARLAPAGLGAALAAAVAVVLVLALGGPGGGGASRVVRAEVNARGAVATLQVSGARAELTMARMPQVQAGRTYEVWISRGGAPVPTDALFSVDASGSATVAVPGSVRGVREVMVTSEPLGGSLAPTRSPVVIARLS